MGHWAGSLLTGMNPNDGGHTLRLQCRIDLVQGNLGWVGAQLRTAGSTGHGNKPRLFQSAENVADDHRIAPRTLGQKIAGHLGNPFRFMDKDQAVNRNRTFHTDLHRCSISFQR